MGSETSATASFSSAMSRLALDTDLADLTVSCGGKEWKVHSTILAVRSPFFKVAINNNKEVKQEMKIDIEEFDPEAMDHVIKFMYGKIVEKGSFKFLFEAAQRFQMDDLKENVIKLAKKKMTVENVIEIGHLAENYDIEHLVDKCAKLIVKKNIHMKEQDVSLSPKLTVKILAKLMAGNQNEENTEDKSSEESSSKESVDASLVSLMNKLVRDRDHRDLTLTCGDREWKVHSFVLAVRSPFFMAAVTNNMVEKRDMKIGIEEFDPDTMDDVINFMYGKLIEKGSFKFLFEAAERFQINDLKDDVVKLAKKNVNSENVVELGHLSEMYNIQSILEQCAKFIVKNDVKMEEDDLSPKLTVLVLRTLKDANKGLKDANQGLKDANQGLKDANQGLKDANRIANQKLHDAERKEMRLEDQLKKAYRCHRCYEECVTKAGLTLHYNKKHHICD